MQSQEVKGRGNQERGITTATASETLESETVDMIITTIANRLTEILAIETLETCGILVTPTTAVGIGISETRETETSGIPEMFETGVICERGTCAIYEIHGICET